MIFLLKTNIALIDLELILWKKPLGIEFLVSRNCDAIIAHVEGVSDEYLIEMNEDKCPIYLVSRYVDSLKDKCISLDNELGGYLATKAVIEQGHKDIAYIAGPQFKPDALNRLEGHKRALKEHGLTFNEELFYIGDFKETGGQAALNIFMNNKASFSAVVCANDEMASGAMKYAREHGLHLPEDLSIIGFDNINFANYLYPTLTTVDNPVGEMGSMAAKLVLKNVYKQNKVNVNQVFEPKLVIRNSVAKV